MIDYQTLPEPAGSAVSVPRHLSLVSPASDAGKAAPTAHATRDAGDDRLLAVVAQRGDEAAFEELYSKHFSRVLAAAMQICGSKAIAEEIAQRTFMTMWERAERLAAKSVRLRPWLITVARNASIDHVRSQAMLVPLADAACGTSDACDPQDTAVTNAALSDLRRALETLPARQREVIELMYVQGLTFKAIAEATGEALGTVKSRAYLALERMRRTMCETGAY